VCVNNTYIYICIHKYVHLQLYIYIFCMFMSARISETMPLYDILNEFQKGHSHMAVVVREHRDAEQTTTENSIGKHRHALFNYPVIDL